MRVSFNSINPGFNGCYKIPSKELVNLEKVIDKNINPGFKETIISAITALGYTNLYMDKKVTIAFFIGNNPLDFFIQNAKHELLFVRPTKDEIKVLGRRRKNETSLAYLDKLNQYRFNKATNMEMDVSSLYGGQKGDDIYIFTGKSNINKSDDIRDFLDLMKEMNRIYNSKHPDRYASPIEKFWKNAVNIFKSLKKANRPAEPYFYRALKDLIEENKSYQKLFDKFIAGKEAKEFKTAEELAKEVFNA